jgi:O-antigen/teichoic acid export membrane protein
MHFKFEPVKHDGNYLIMTLFRQSSLAAIAAIVFSVSRFALAVIVARRLSPAGFGQFFYAQWLVDMAFLVCSFGATGAVSRYAAEYRSDAAKLSVFIRNWRPWALGLPLLAGVAVLFSSWISGFTPSLTSVLCLGLWAIASAAWAMQTAALTGFQRFDLILYANLIAASTMLAGALMLPLMANNPAILFALMAAASGMAALPGLSQTLSHKLVERAAPINDVQRRSVLRYAANMWLIGLLWALLWSRGELLIVKLFMGDAGVASYAAALTLFGAAIQGSMLGMSAVAPHLTRLWGEGRMDETLEMARSVMDVQLLVCGTAASVMICLGPELLSLTFGPSYRVQSGTLAILSVGLVSIALANQNHLLQIATDGRYSRNTSLVGLLILMGLALTLIPAYGVNGAALARVTTMLMLACLSMYTVSRQWGAGAISLTNLTVVLGLMVVVVCLSALLSDVQWTLRGALLAFSLLAFSVAIRDRHGKIKLIFIINRIRALRRTGGVLSDEL